MAFEFSKHFWNEDVVDTTGFDRVVEQLTHGKRVSKGIGEFIKVRIGIEQEYARALTKMVRHNGVTTGGTLGASWQSVCMTTEQTANAHFKMSESLSDLLKQVQDHLTERKSMREKTETNIRKLQSNKKTAHDKLKKSQADYYRRCEAIESFKYQVKAARADKNKQKDVAKHEKNVNKAQHAMMETKKIYNTQLDTLDKARRKWEVENDEALLVFQRLEENRIAFTRQLMWQYANLISASAVEVDKYQKNLRATLEECSVSGDLEQFVTTKGTGSKRPAEIKFQEHPSLQKNSAKRSETTRRKDVAEKSDGRSKSERRVKPAYDNPEYHSIGASPNSSSTTEQPTEVVASPAKSSKSPKTRDDATDREMSDASSSRKERKSKKENAPEDPEIKTTKLITSTPKADDEKERIHSATDTEEKVSKPPRRRKSKDPELNRPSSLIVVPTIKQAAEAEEAARPKSEIVEDEDKPVMRSLKKEKSPKSSNKRLSRISLKDEFPNIKDDPTIEDSDFSVGTLELKADGTIIKTSIDEDSRKHHRHEKKSSKRHSMKSPERTVINQEELPESHKSPDTKKLTVTSEAEEAAPASVKTEIEKKDEPTPDPIETSHVSTNLESSPVSNPPVGISRVPFFAQNETDFVSPPRKELPRPKESPPAIPKVKNEKSTSDIRPKSPFAKAVEKEAQGFGKPERPPRPDELESTTEQGSTVEIISPENKSVERNSRSPSRGDLDPPRGISAVQTHPAAKASRFPALQENGGDTVAQKPEHQHASVTRQERIELDPPPFRDPPPKLPTSPPPDDDEEDERPTPYSTPIRSPGSGYSTFRLLHLNSVTKKQLSVTTSSSTEVSSSTPSGPSSSETPETNTVADSPIRNIDDDSGTEAVEESVERSFTEVLGEDHREGSNIVTKTTVETVEDAVKL